MNYIQNKEKNKKIIMEKCNNIPNKPGIYIFTREEIDGFRYAYIGQSVHMLDRLAEHLGGYKEMGNSLRKHGWYSINNIEGWKVQYILCDENRLNELERQYIKTYADMGYQLKNKTKGGQDAGKNGLDNQKQPKGYYDGVAQGRKKLINEIKVFLDKYLDITIKGTSNKTKERKLNEFKMLFDIVD